MANFFPILLALLAIAAQSASQSLQWEPDVDIIHDHSIMVSWSSPAFCETFNLSFSSWNFTIDSTVGDFSQFVMINETRGANETYGSIQIDQLSQSTSYYLSVREVCNGTAVTSIAINRTITTSATTTYAPIFNITLSNPPTTNDDYFSARWLFQIGMDNCSAMLPGDTVSFYLNATDLIYQNTTTYIPTSSRAFTQRVLPSRNYSLSFYAVCNISKFVFTPVQFNYVTPGRTFPPLYPSVHKMATYAKLSWVLGPRSRYDCVYYNSTNVGWVIRDVYSSYNCTSTTLSQEVDCPLQWNTTYSLYIQFVCTNSIYNSPITLFNGGNFTSYPKRAYPPYLNSVNQDNNMTLLWDLSLDSPSCHDVGSQFSNWTFTIVGREQNMTVVSTDYYASSLSIGDLIPYITYDLSVREMCTNDSLSSDPYTTTHTFQATQPSQPQIDFVVLSPSSIGIWLSPFNYDCIDLESSSIDEVLNYTISPYTNYLEAEENVDLNYYYFNNLSSSTNYTITISKVCQMDVGPDVISENLTLNIQTLAPGQIYVPITSNMTLQGPGYSVTVGCEPDTFTSDVSGLGFTFLSSPPNTEHLASALNISFDLKALQFGGPVPSSHLSSPITFTFSIGQWNESTRPELYYLDSSTGSYRLAAGTCQGKDYMNDFDGLGGSWNVSVCHLTRFDAFTEVTVVPSSTSSEGTSTTGRRRGAVIFGLVVLSLLLTAVVVGLGAWAYRTYKKRRAAERQWIDLNTVTEDEI